MSPSIEPLPVQKLDALLTQSVGKNFQIKHLEWSPLTAPGENFGSVMLAITVTLTRPTDKTETLNLVAKLPPTSAYLLDLFNSPVSFQKELYFYNSMAKEFLDLQTENGMKGKDPCNLVPKFFGGRLGLKAHDEFDAQAAIILENLKCSGYDTEDRIFGLDRKHTKFAIEGLAKMHAFTIALKLKKPQVYEEIATNVFLDIWNETTAKCVNDMIRKAQSDIQDIEELKPFVDRVNKTIEYGIMYEKTRKSAEEPWATLIHNDFWVNNMMFQHNEQGELLDMKIVDFQLCLYDYGMKDLIFFLVSSANKEILDNNMDEMIDWYYSCFINALKMLRVDTEKFTKQKFDEIVGHCGQVKFNQCIMMVQVIQAPRKTASDITVIKENNVFTSTAGNDIYRQKLMTIVNLFDKRGWLRK
ncbi:PREDICTED: uncharacterized protein LOC108550901 [Eufriesea mexicana]|uniref:uncharacterized protein LOC108550901 n=1 Tax=Eufriesea mexicana TaxID=516756 RepID=UPI00083C4BB4|nr:PREDICTED: uncharacterized protein LOC108550901 [Eufriesea mexicana]XP_017760293.1 PREDICTED: uncharacterized protein LOC108550901 [Eufriesea mexicana]XP_017760294.1 PREDICTED: uncharacterized protein LOC108550901 [Eufriesea mexicana]XP_017760295.1 PREDICTED: uncharacterized protein LOC108550901 [Eufriesea mexicana]XP_017760296.1 PREDICTED: uncharacterized protein LOC108550901 [Eufriesea mexicana]XP_017760298.1 PREDICTED: uncharacterized protein LOC108550901 [Eufriesea mexicana]XP_01776029